MKWIASIHLENLQSHKDTKLDFVAPGVNVIVGPSRQGKTTIFRGFRKVLENRPIAGIEGWIHKHNKKNQIKISLETMDGKSISWNGPEQQKYTVNGQELRGFGQTVPTLVTDSMNMNDINIQHQFELPFLVFDPPGQVAKYLNQVIELESIDRAMSNIGSMKRKNDQNIRIQEETILELEKVKASFPDLLIVEDFIVNLEEFDTRIKEKTQRGVQLSTIQEHLAGYREKLTQISVPVGVEKKANDLIEKNLEKEQKQYTMDFLFSIQSNLVSCRGRLNELNMIVTKKEMVELLLSKNETLKEKKWVLSKLGEIQKNILKEKKKYSQFCGIIRQREEEYTALWPGICPLCGKA